MADNNDLNREIDKRVKIIDGKLKDAFSLIKKDIQDIKKNSTKSNTVDTSNIESKIEQLKKEIQSKTDKIQKIQSVKTVVQPDYKEIAKLQLKLNELKKEQELKEKIENEKRKQEALKHKLELKKQEAKIFRKQSEQFKDLTENASKSFSQTLKEIKKEQQKAIEESKKQYEKSIQKNLQQQEEIKELYEAKIAELQIQHSMDKAQVESKYSQELSKFEQEQESLKSELYSLGKQLDKVQSKKQYVKQGPGFWASLFSSSKSSKPVVKEVKQPKKEVYKDNTKRNRAILQLLVVIIPAILLGYVLYANFLASHEFNYFYDIGSEADAKKPYLSPLNRVSDIINSSDNSYRNLTSNLVYFDVSVPIGANSIDIQSRILNTNSESNILIGAKNKQEWSYYQKTAYSAFLESLSNPIYSDANITIWKTNSEAKDISSISEIENGARVATDLPLKLQQTNANYDIQNSTINTALRGGHTFYVYLKGSLDLYVEKRDLNWYNGTDEMNVSLYDLEGNLLGNTMLSDDGFNLTERKSNQTVSGNLNVNDIDSGVYRIVFSDADALITQIKLNTNKIVTNKLFLADANTYTQQGDKATTIFSSSTKDSVLRFNTYHGPYLQNITIGNRFFEITKINSNSPVNLSSGSYYITSPKSNVIVSSSSMISFSENNYFEPFKYSTTSIPTSSADLSGVDYIISGYKPTVKDGDWIITNTRFDIQDLYIQNNKLSLLFNVPALSGESNSTGQVGVDWINTTIQKNGLTITWI